MKKQRSRICKQCRATVHIPQSELADMIAGRPGLSFQSHPRIPLDAEIVGGGYDPSRCEVKLIYTSERGFLMSEGTETPERELATLPDDQDPVELRGMVTDYLEDFPGEAARLGHLALVILEEVRSALFQQQVGITRVE